MAVESEHLRHRTWLRRSSAAAALTALGVVYGDIDTSLLYAFKVAVQAAGGDVRVAAVGVASLIIWSLVLVVSIKYALLILRVDNNGEAHGQSAATAGAALSRPPWHSIRIYSQSTRRRCAAG